MRVDPAHPETVYAATHARTHFEVDGFFRSSDGGAHWTQLSAVDLAPLAPFWIAFDPFNPDMVYAEHYPDVYRSTDQGQTWAPLAIDLPRSVFSALLADPASQGTLYSLTAP